MQINLYIEVLNLMHNTIKGVFMIVENKYFEDIKRIWKENNSGYITEESNETLIKNNDILIKCCEYI